MQSILWSLIRLATARCNLNFRSMQGIWNSWGLSTWGIDPSDSLVGIPVLLTGLLAQTVRAVVKLWSFLRSLGGLACVTVSVYHCAVYRLCSGCCCFYSTFGLGHMLSRLPIAKEHAGNERSALRDVSQSLTPTGERFIRVRPH